MRKLKKEITIIEIPSPGVLGGVYSDLIMALSHSINSLGFKVNYERNLSRRMNPVIILGLYRKFINTSPLIDMPSHYFNFNLTPLFHNTTPPWFENYLQCTLKHNQIDYSLRNISVPKDESSSSRRVHLFNFGYFDLMPFNGFERGDNYLFYGKYNEERLQRLKDLQKKGTKINALQNVWGHERDIQIRQAKAIVNIRKFNKNILEVYRIWHSLCLGTPVYSDAGTDESLNMQYSQYINISERLEADSLQVPPVSPSIYKRETSFIESVDSLLEFICK